MSHGTEGAIMDPRREPGGRTHVPDDQRDLPRERVRASCCGAYVYRVEDAEDVWYETRSGEPHECPRRDGQRRERCQYTIQRPAPIPTHDPPGTRKYPWGQMEPGDHFVVRCDPEESRSVSKRLASSGYLWCKRNRPGMRIATHECGLGVRVYMHEKVEGDSP